MIEAIEAGWTIEFSRSNLAKAIVEREYELQPERRTRYDTSAYEKDIQGTLNNLSFLTEALKAASPSLFFDHIAWAKTVLFAQGIRTQEFEIKLRCIQEILANQLPADLNRHASDYLEQVLRDFSGMPEELPSFIDKSNPLIDLAQKYMNALLSGDRKIAMRYIMVGVDQGNTLEDIYLYVFQCVLREVGQLWQTNQISIAQEHYCSAATQLIMSQLYPQIISRKRNGRKIVLACVSGEQHEIGVRMLSDFFEMDGWNAYYVGANTPAAGILEALTHHHQSDILALSATMTWHVSKVREAISLVRSSKQGRRIKIIVGGYPFVIEPNLWRQVGADAFAVDARAAIEVANNL